MPISAPYWYTPNAYTFVIGWNKKQINDADNFASWRDLLKPEYKGKIITGDVRKGVTYTYTYMGLSKALGPDFFPSLSKQEPALLLRSEELVQKAISGENPIYSFALPSRVYQAKRADPKLDMGLSFPKEGIVLVPVSIGVLAKAPHPNAGKLFANWLMTEEAQTIVINNEPEFSMRAGLKPPPEVAPYAPSPDQVKVAPLDYLKITAQDLTNAQNQFRKDMGVD
ncbi:MAG: extracellular solute-binding protein, partial [Chloroflexi bacterium]|nr:extracellular solute-binding protein [Chloroflexota bacterium]